MTIKYPIPQGTNEAWASANDRLKMFLSNIFDPNQQTMPPTMPGMETQMPKSLTDHMAEMILFGVGIPDKDKK